MSKTWMDSMTESELELEMKSCHDRIKEIPEVNSSPWPTHYAKEHNLNAKIKIIEFELVERYFTGGNKDGSKN